MSLESLGKYTQANMWTNLTNTYIHWKFFFFDYRDYWQILIYIWILFLWDFKSKERYNSDMLSTLPADLTQSQLIQCKIIPMQKMRYLNIEHEYRSISLTSSNTINRLTGQGALCTHLIYSSKQPSRQLIPSFYNWGGRWELSRQLKKQCVPYRLSLKDRTVSIKVSRQKQSG